MAKDKFTTELQENYAIITHQMNTALTTMQLLLEGDANCHRKELQSEIVSLKQYADMIVPFFQLQHMTKELNIQSLFLEDITKQVLKKSVMQFIAKENKLHFYPMNCQVLSDKKWLSAALELALFAISKNCRKDTISVYLDPLHKSTLVIENQSNCYSQEAIERILAQGYAGAETKNEKQTTGIELYLCYQIIMNLSHHIQVATNPSKGIKIMIQF